MKFFIAFALLVTVASAATIKGDYQPVHVGPAIVDQYHPVHVGPAIVDDYHPIHVGPAFIDEYQPAHVELPVLDFPVGVDGAVVPAPADVPAVSSAPLVQIIVNVKQQTPGGPNPVQVVDGAEVGVAPTPVEIVEEAVNDYEPVLVMDPFPVVPEPVVVAPIVVEPAVVAPEILN